MSSSLGRAGRRDGDANWNQPGVKSFVSLCCFPSPEGSQGGKRSSQAAMSAETQDSCFITLKPHSPGIAADTPRMSPTSKDQLTTSVPPWQSSKHCFPANTVTLLGKGCGKQQWHGVKCSPLSGCPILGQREGKISKPTVFRRSLRGS